MHKRASLLSLRKGLLIVFAALVLAGCAGQLPAGDEGTPVPISPVDIPLADLLVYVPAGPFYMGSDPDVDPLAEEDEVPLHPVLLDGYFIYRNEVSNALYKQCVAAGLCSDPTMFEDGPSTHYNDEEFKDNPVVGVTWDQANAFCTWANGRLPTEAEWEKTARGENGDLYPWGADEPSCTLSNMAGCFVDPPDTDKVGQYPTGESEYEANDMSGNVWEWTLDWYLETYYAQSPDSNPLGPDQGELRVVRGGSYEDAAAALRSAERLGLDPDEAYNNVGFRCVPIGVEESAVVPPFCQPTYVPFCRDPNKDPNEDCDPTQSGENPQDPGGIPDYELIGFGCPNNGVVTITIDAGGPAADNNTVTVGGVVYTCTDSTEYPGRLICTGNAPTMGTYTEITVCPDGSAAAGSGLIAYQPQAAPAPKLVGYSPAQTGGDQLVAYAAAAPQARPALQAYAPSQTGAAALQAYDPSAAAPSLVAYQSTAGTTCPTGYLLNPTTGQCEQDPNGACPDGWTFNTETNQCEPGDSGCPEGTTLSATNQGCEPTTGQDCPDGFTYLAASNTCEPPGNDDGGGACPAGYFFDNNINCCSPIPGDNFGCEPGFYRSVASNECEPTDQDGCGPNLTYNPYEGGCVPDTGDEQTGDEGCRQEGYVMNDAGQCVPGDTTITRTVGGCDTDSYYDPNLQECVQLEEGQCGPGYRLNPLTNSCIPTDGPGSGCAAGYAYNSRLGCCSETPGTDGSSCLGDPDTAGQPTNLTAFPPPSTTGYDYGQGYCDPTGDEQCPDGWTYDPEQQACVSVTTVERILQTGCPEGTYFDDDLGYCVQTSCGCELGYYYDTDSQTCLPYGGEQPTGLGCWSYTISVPVCEYSTPTVPVCDDGETYVPSTGKCEREPDEPLTCADYGNQTACNAAGCNWYQFSVPPCYP